MLKTIVLSVLLSVATIGSTAQYVVSGYVTDASSGESLAGATITIVPGKKKGVVSNRYGFYSLSLPGGTYSFQVQFIGYKAQTVEINLNSTRRFNIELYEKTFNIGNVDVVAGSTDKSISAVEMGHITLTPRQIKHIPVIFGEPDIIKTMQLKPGIKPASEGSTGFHVRGGGTDQNLILLDEAPVYNASHLLGFFSVFNSDAIKNAELMKGSIPAEYGGRASSVLTIQMKEGNRKELTTSGSLGLIASKLTVEGPLVKDKSSFMVSGRRTYADLFLNFSSNDKVKNSHLYFYDFNLKTNYKINEKNRVFVSGYFGRDDFGYKNEFGFDWGSVTGTLRWNHIFSEKIFSNTSFIYSNYSYQIDAMSGLDLTIRSEINDLNFKQDFSYYASPEHTLKFGGNVIYHNILPGRITVNDINSIFESREITQRKAIEWAAYFSGNYIFSPEFKVYYGIRYALFSNIGPGEFYRFDNSGNLLETIEKERFGIVKTQGGAGPRFGLAYMPGKNSAVKAGFNRIYQFLHLLSNSTTSTPTDLWLPSSNNVKPQIADQVSAGYFSNFKNNTYETSVEVYYKNLHNQIDYKNGAQLRLNSTVEAELVFGRGWAYGTEFMVKKNTGRLSGWLAYTWSKTMKQFDEINSGEPFPARHDRTHDVSIVGLYQLTPKLSFSATWVYYTGNAVTFPSGKYEIEGQLVGYYTERNGYRMPDYHRLDFGITWQTRKNKRFESSWNFSVYNAYARENAYFIDFRQNVDNPGSTEAVQISLFRAIPSVSYRFKF